MQMTTGSSSSFSEIPPRLNYSQEFPTSSKNAVRIGDGEEVDSPEPILSPPLYISPCEQAPTPTSNKRNWLRREEEVVVPCHLMHFTDKTIATNPGKEKDNDNKLASNPNNDSSSKRGRLDDGNKVLTPHAEDVGDHDSRGIGQPVKKVKANKRRGEAAMVLSAHLQKLAEIKAKNLILWKEKLELYMEKEKLKVKQMALQDWKVKWDMWKTLSSNTFPLTSVEEKHKEEILSEVSSFLFGQK